MLDATLTEFLGWCLVINSCFLVFTSIALLVFKTQILAIHHKLTDVSHDELHTQYFRYLANFKILIIVFNLTPYIALKLMA